MRSVHQSGGKNHSFSGLHDHGDRLGLIRLPIGIHLQGPIVISEKTACNALLPLFVDAVGLIGHTLGFVVVHRQMGPRYELKTGGILGSFRKRGPNGYGAAEFLH